MKMPKVAKCFFIYRVISNKKRVECSGSSCEKIQHNQAMLRGLHKATTTPTILPKTRFAQAAKQQMQKVTTSKPIEPSKAILYGFRTQHYARIDIVFLVV
jgi:hypothetical protein